MNNKQTNILSYLDHCYILFGQQQQSVLYCGSKTAMIP
uniref:Uncharacterized protein n=1 Tax=Anguilla anguilla TaxID=7936 RepID=A0A0E9R5T2_ANGAN